MKRNLTGYQFGIYVLNKIKCKQSIIQFQWKCLHNIVYSEYRLQKMGKSNGHGQCHFCKNEIESLIYAFVLQVSYN